MKLSEVCTVAVFTVTVTLGVNALDQGINFVKTTDSSMDLKTEYETKRQEFDTRDLKLNREYAIENKMNHDEYYKLSQRINLDREEYRISNEKLNTALEHKIVKYAKGFVLSIIGFMISLFILKGIM